MSDRRLVGIDGCLHTRITIALVENLANSMNWSGVPVLLNGTIKYITWIVTTLEVVYFGKIDSERVEARNFQKKWKKI